MPKSPTSFKHPRHMTTEEAVSHLFHPKVVEHVKNQKDEPKRKPKKQPTKKG